MAANITLITAGGESIQYEGVTRWSTNEREIEFYAQADDGHPVRVVSNLKYLIEDDNVG